MTPVPERAPRLVVGLGNVLAGDDGIGIRLAEALAGDPALPADVEVLVGGADLLRVAPFLRGRRELLLLDAEQGDPPGRLTVLPRGPALAARAAHAHRMNPTQALELLRVADEALQRVRITWLLVAISEARVGAGLSPALQARVPALVGELLRLLA